MKCAYYQTKKERRMTSEDKKKLGWIFEQVVKEKLKETKERKETENESIRDN